MHMPLNPGLQQKAVNWAKHSEGADILGQSRSFPAI